MVTADYNFRHCILYTEWPNEINEMPRVSLKRAPSDRLYNWWAGPHMLL